MSHFYCLFTNRCVSLGARLGFLKNTCTCTDPLSTFEKNKRQHFGPGLPPPPPPPRGNFLFPHKFIAMNTVK